MQSSNSKTNRNPRERHELVHFVLQIAAPAVEVDLLTLTRGDAALSVLGVPFFDWAPVACAIWALLVVYCGPFGIPERLTAIVKEKKRYVAQCNPGSSESGDQGDVLVPRV